VPAGADAADGDEDADEQAASPMNAQEASDETTTLRLEFMSASHSGR
jgi:hypothetical protein